MTGLPLIDSYMWWLRKGYNLNAFVESVMVREQGWDLYKQRYERIEVPNS